MTPLLANSPLKQTHDVLDPENIELALLALPSDVWQQVQEPSIVKREDGTYKTGDTFFDSMEDALASGEDIHELIRKLNSP